MSKPKFYTFYDRPPEVTTVLDYDTKLVDQSEADMCGLDYQLQRFGIDGLQARFEAMKDKFGYADTRMLPSFAELQNRIVKGTEYFNNLPSEIRAKFNHQPENFFTYLEENPQQAVKDGYVSNVYINDILPKQQEQINQVLDKVEPTVEPVQKDEISA